MKTSHNITNYIKSSINENVTSDRVWTLPNAITIFRIIIIPVFATLMALGFNIECLLLMIVCAISDFFDGYFARKLNSVTRVGKILDPIADRLMIFVTLVMLTATGYLSIVACLVMFVRETMLFFLYGTLVLNGKSPIAVSFVGKVATAGLLFSMPLIFLTSFLKLSVFYWNNLHYFGVILLIISLMLYWVAGIEYAYKSFVIIKTFGKSAIYKILLALVVTTIIASLFVFVVISLVPHSMLFNMF